MKRWIVGLCVIAGLFPSVAFGCDMPAIDGKPAFRWPLNWPMTAAFGEKFHPLLQLKLWHPGIDIAAPVGTPVSAALPGRVSKAAYIGDYGNSITIDHGGGWETSYSHLQRFSVREGDCVPSGGEIGKVGATGLVEGPNLHFEIRRDGRTVDPTNFLPGR
jgi:murein DD-endopeptidase MepM/ murein hydrolase activator NlpD